MTANTLKTPASRVVNTRLTGLAVIFWKNGAFFNYLIAI
jgi:hypothetical protein